MGNIVDLLTGRSERRTNIIYLLIGRERRVGVVMRQLTSGRKDAIRLRSVKKTKDAVGLLTKQKTLWVC